MPTIKGLSNQGRALIDDLTPADQRTTLGLGTVAVISTTGETTKYLRADGTWVVPPSAEGSGITELTGDVTAGPGSGQQAATIANDAVTYAKMQNVSATDKLLGRSTAGAGNVEEIPLTAAGRALIDDADAAAQRTTLGLGSVDNTSDAGKPVSAAQQTALDLKANLASPTFTGTVAGITAAMVGAPSGSGTSSGTNTGDQTAIPNTNLALVLTKTYKGRTSAGTGTPQDVPVATLKTDLALVKGDVGLGNVDNTSDAAKPVSTATQTALNLKANAPAQTEIDFGATPVSEASFLIADANVTPTSKIIGNVAYEAPTGKDLDELEMDSLDLKFGPGSGQFTLYARGLDGDIADTFKINYLVG